MGEKRQAKKVITVKRGANTTRKIEVFSGSLFTGKTFVDVLSDDIPASSDRSTLYRLRVNGKWFPAREKVLYDLGAVNEIVLKLIGEL